jgi:type VI secretion system protein VasJ
MNQPTQASTPEWLSDIATALPETHCGEDPRYLDEFQKVKEEIDKLRDVDYAMIQTTCRDLLTRVTKDLRVAGYHIAAGTYVDGLSGLLDGLRVYRVLLENFWDDCHPNRETARLAALNLLGNPRITAFAEQHEQGAGFETFEALQQEIDAINGFLIEKLGEEVPRLSALGQWVAGRLKRLKPSEPVAEEPAAATAADAVQQPSSGGAEPAPGAVNSEQAVERLTRQVHNHLIDAGDLLRALAYSRAFRWGALALPPNEGGRTRIPAPRASGLAELENALSQPSLQNAVVCCENLFFEPGFHLLFDLQFKAFEYCEANDRSDLAGYIRNTLQDLLERHPQLAELQFDDGTPFAGTQCRQWIQQWDAAGIGSGGPASGDPQADEEAAAAIDEATKLAKHKKLTEALRCIDDLPVGTEKQRIQKRLAEACLCLSAGKAPMAEVVLADIQDYILAHHLPTWDPGLAVEVLRQRYAALQAMGKNSPGENKQQIIQQGHEVRELICKIDVIAAAALI